MGSYKGLEKSWISYRWDAPFVARAPGLLSFLTWIEVYALCGMSSQSSLIMRCTSATARVYAPCGMQSWLLKVASILGDMQRCTSSAACNPGPLSFLT